jgi:hypothetical protein
MWKPQGPPNQPGLEGSRAFVVLWHDVSQERHPRLDPEQKRICTWPVDIQLQLIRLACSILSAPQKDPGH